MVVHLDSFEAARVYPSFARVSDEAFEVVATERVGQVVSFGRDVLLGGFPIDRGVLLGTCLQDTAHDDGLGLVVLRVGFRGCVVDGFHDVVTREKIAEDVGCEQRGVEFLAVYVRFDL